MTHLTTDTVAKALANATSKESSNENLFEKIQVISTDDGNVISVKQDIDGHTAFVTVDEDQVRTVSYLWKTEDIAEDQREEILIAMLKESMSLPLVSFGIDGDEVTLFGSMSTLSGEDELIEEVEALFAATQLVTSQIESFVKP
jgi:uncharacterized protein YjfI (DUF2170 family)